MEQLIMSPAAGERWLRFTGDRICFELFFADGRKLPRGWRALVRTNLGRAAALREEIIASYFHERPLAVASWQDYPMAASETKWVLELPVSEVGFFRAKAYALDDQSRQHWPDGADAGISVHPDAYRTANSIYCAFVRLFGESKLLAAARREAGEARLKALDKQGYTVIPPSGKFRDLIRELPHIIDGLGCRIVHLLPVNPTPTTFARMGRFGSPYAALDLTGIDPALVEFDRRTTGVDQFCELADAIHARQARLFLDLVINHTGWGSILLETHPDWFLRGADGQFVSPGAWGTIWADLVELDHGRTVSWDYLAEVFLTWCRRGVDGFRCDAGYKIPLAAWKFIVARVRQEYPDTLFLLEGLGGAWDLTENLLTEGGMQWAYSELFQNYSGSHVAGYLDHSFAQSNRVGVLAHYSETHDNNRLAAQGKRWSLLRNRLSALGSTHGAFGFTCGVEWLASEKILVHQSSGLAWNSSDNLVAELAALNRLLAQHPCFFDGARCVRLSPADSPVYVLRRDSADGLDCVLVLVNTDARLPHELRLDRGVFEDAGGPGTDLLGQRFKPPAESGGAIVFSLEPGACYCLSASNQPQGLCGEAYRRARAQNAWAISALCHSAVLNEVGHWTWKELAGLVEKEPAKFLAALAYLRAEKEEPDLARRLHRAFEAGHYPGVVVWMPMDARRITLVPPAHWILVRDTGRFRATLAGLESGAAPPVHQESIPVTDGHVACFPPGPARGDASLTMIRYGTGPGQVTGRIRFLAAAPGWSRAEDFPLWTGKGNVSVGKRLPSPEGTAPLVLLTNARGGMARVCVDLGKVQSKYDCILAANLHVAVPVDRHVLVKRVRIWANANGFITPLDGENLVHFDPGPPAHWRFVAGAGAGRAVEVHLSMDMIDHQNATVLRLSRPLHPPVVGEDLPEELEVRLTIRFDIEDRNFHAETKRSPGADDHFGRHCRPLAGQPGFEFTPAPERRLRVWSSAGVYHAHAEWSENLPHPIEQSRGQIACGDAFSPGWFDLQLRKGASVLLCLSADPDRTVGETLGTFESIRQALDDRSAAPAGLESHDAFGRQLARAAQAFVVQRNSAQTIIAGYPWFLDWGRDSLICARGLLAAGMTEEVRQLLITFGRFEQNGTLPNTIHGADATNRDTSDAPLWYGVVCEEAAALLGKPLYEVKVDRQGRTISDVLRSIALHYAGGTPNGIRMDPDSALVWSPKHFTWMDTNYPAGTPREGYPIEIQALWIRLLRQLERLGAAPAGRRPWRDLAERAQQSFEARFWLAEEGYWADVLLAAAGQPARAAIPDRALRCNALLPASLGLACGPRAQATTETARRYLLVPGAVRSLAPLPISPPLPIHAPDGRLLNDPNNPYWGRYEGDEDASRKPAYHNGTAWVWMLSVFCEALARAWSFAPEAVAASTAYLGSLEGRLREGCLGHLPEIVDGDAPHRPRGCDAQAWSVTEALRVWKLLSSR